MAETTHISWADMTHNEWLPEPAIERAGGPSFHLFEDGTWMQRVGKKDAGRALDGVVHDARPEVVAYSFTVARRSIDAEG